MKFDSIHSIKLVFKAAQEGIYADNSLNKKLGRVGMSYKQYKDFLKKEEKFYTTIAPYLDTVLTKENKKQITEKCFNTFITQAKTIADSLNIKYSKFDTNRGGYVLQEGQKAGTAIQELSFTFELKDANQKQADAFCCLMGDLGYENQEAVISYNYLKMENKNDADALEISFPVKDIEKAINSLKLAKIENFTINESTKEIKLLQFDTNDELFIEQLDKLQIILKKDNNYDQIKFAKTTPIKSRYLERKDRQSFYQERLKDPNLERGGRLWNLYTKAKKEVEGYLSK